MTLEKMQQEVGLQTLPDCFGALYENIRDTWMSRSEQILSDAYIRDVLEENRLMIPWLDQILAAAAQVRENLAMRLWVCLLEQWIRV